MKKFLLPLVAVVSFASLASAQVPGWVQRPQDWGKNGVVIFPPRPPEYHTPIVEVPSGPSRPAEPGIQFDQGVQTRPNVQVIGGNRFLQRDGQLHRLAPRPTGPSTSTVRPGAQLGQQSGALIWQNGRWVRQP